MAVLKWYNKWYYVVGAMILIVGIYFATRKAITYISVHDYLKTQVEVLERENIKLDSLYKITAAQKDKIKIIKEKIDISEDIKKLKDLIDEYEAIKKDTTPSIQPTPKELLDYLNKEF